MPGYAAVIGKFVHLVLEKLYQFPKGYRNDGVANKLANSCYEEFVAEDSDMQLMLPEMSEQDIRDFKHQAWDMILGIWDLEDPQEIEVISTEKDVEIIIDGVPFKGYIDRISRDKNGKLIISDYKSGKPPDNRYKGPKLAQVVLYSAAINELMQERPHKAELLYLGNKTLSIKPTEKLMEAEVGRFKQTWDDIHKSLETETFEVRTGPLCAWCPHVDICPAGQEEVMVRWKKGRVREDAPALAILGISSLDTL